MELDDLFHVFSLVSRSEGISRSTLAIICYAASGFENRATLDKNYRKMVEMNFDRYAFLFAELKGSQPLLVLPDFLDQLATRTGYFQVRYSDAVDYGFRRSFLDLSEPDVNTRWAVVLMKRRGLEWDAPWYKAVQLYGEILGAKNDFMERANSFFIEYERHRK